MHHPYGEEVLDLLVFNQHYITSHSLSLPPHIHPLSFLFSPLSVLGCSIFENCKRCNNGTWGPRDDFFVKGKYCAECRPGWSGGDCLSEYTHSHIFLYPHYLLPSLRVKCALNHRSRIRLLYSPSSNQNHYGDERISDLVSGL